MSNSVLEQALEALKDYVDFSREVDVGGGDVVIATCESRVSAVAAIAALKEAIKNQGEPVAEVVAGNFGNRLTWATEGAQVDTPVGTMLYTSAPTIPKALDRSCDEHNDACWAYQDGWNQCRKAMLSAPKGEKG